MQAPALRQELARRTDTLIRLVEKEQEDYDAVDVDEPKVSLLPAICVSQRCTSGAWLPFADACMHAACTVHGFLLGQVRDELHWAWRCTCT